ncbi:MAG: protein disulfide oxidoreductase [gamma proteobacterium symbiont of Bathyaustriella thionipta]|nr:protein disulfide oxidoreductase [gamma proteobacterium symbiont of Bathyaustriella thionipta]
MPEVQAKSFIRGSLKWLLQILLFIGIIWALNLWRTQDTASGMAPVLQGSLLNGDWQSVNLADGKPLLVHFWASWCPLCRFEASSIDSLSRSHCVVTVALQSGTAEEVVQYLADEQLDLMVLNDPDGEIARKWGVRGVPASFVVDGRGRIQSTEIGYTSQLGLWLRLWLAE